MLHLLFYEPLVSGYIEALPQTGVWLESWTFLG
jgi:hypothetical protein